MQFLISKSVPTLLTNDSVELQYENSCVDQTNSNCEPIMISDDDSDANFKIVGKINAIHIHECNSRDLLEKKKQVSIKVVSRRDESILAIKPGIVSLGKVETGHNIKCTNLCDLSKATENTQVVTNKANVFQNRILKEVDPEVQKRIAERKLTKSIEKDLVDLENENHVKVYSNTHCNALKKNVYLYGLPDDSNLILKSGAEIHDVINDKLVTSEVDSITNNNYQVPVSLEHSFHYPLNNISDDDSLTTTPKKENKLCNASTSFLTLPPNIYLYGNSHLSQQKLLDEIKSEETNVRQQRKRTFQKPLSQSESDRGNGKERHVSPKLQQNPLLHSNLDSKLLRKKLKFQFDFKKCKRRPNVSEDKKSTSNPLATVSALDNGIVKLNADSSPTICDIQLHDGIRLTTSPSITKTLLCEKSFVSQMNSKPFAISTPKKSQTSLKQFGFSSSFSKGDLNYYFFLLKKYFFSYTLACIKSLNPKFLNYNYHI